MARGVATWIPDNMHPETNSLQYGQDYCPRGRCCPAAPPNDDFPPPNSAMFPPPEGSVTTEDNEEDDVESNSSISSWENVDADIRKHIQHCSCSCNHMGYGNFLDYTRQQTTTCMSELPDVTPPPMQQRHITSGLHSNTGSLRRSQGIGGLPPPGLLPPGARCNGRAIPVSELLRGQSFLHLGSSGALHMRDSFSSSSSTKSDTKGWELAARYWCLLLGALLVAAAIGAGLGVPLAMRAVAPHGGGDEQHIDVVRRVLKQTPLIDGHNDLPWNMRMFVHNRLYEFNLTDDLRSVNPWSRSNWSHTDLPRMRTGLMGAQFWSAYVPCGARDLDAVQLALEQIDVIKRISELHPTHLELVTSSHGIETAHRAGRIASLIGVEGGHAIGNSLAVLRMLHDLGARYLTLTHACSTPWAGCAQPGDEQGGEEQGLSDFGKAVIREMNRLGMLVDLSHTSTRTMKDALATAQAPIIFSHSSARALCNTTRNVPDDVLKLVTANGGLVMVNFYPMFITCNDTASITDVVDHINHIRGVAGIDHVGLGAGFDGINLTPRGLEDVGGYPRLFSLLLEQGEWSEAQLHKLAGANLLRVLRTVEKIREEWKLAGVRPGEELVPAEDLQGHTDCMYIQAPSS